MRFVCVGMADEGAFQMESMKELRVGRYIIIDSIPCRVVEIETSAPGKHGSAKMRVTAIGMFDGQKKTIIKPSSADIEVPIVSKRKASVVSVSETSVQLMDAETYEVYELPITDEFRGKLEAGKEVEIIEALGRRSLARVW